MVYTHRNAVLSEPLRQGQPPLGQRLVVMSNRAPVRISYEGGRESIERTVSGVGGTFLHVLERRGGLWIAWSGGQKTPRHLPFPPENPRFTMSFVELSERDVSQYYYGLCNRALWPLMHSMLAKCYFSSTQWRQYWQVNQVFADRAAAEMGPDDMLWIQDFHLALTPRMVRARRGDLPIGVFWHVPFPPAVVYEAFPWRRELLEGMLGSGIIGFHTRAYADNFLDSCERVLGAAVDRQSGEVRHVSGRTRVGVFPLGIPVDYFERISAEPRTGERAAAIRSGIGSEAVVLGVDRLDYTKGILQRVFAYERFLERNPAYRGRVTFLLIAVPTRSKISEYAELKRQLDETIGRVVGRFSTPEWVPIRYVYNQFGTEELIAHYQASDIALITPLRDGMNLVAKEFVASHPADDAVLILSEFAGAAEELTEALLVNPYDVEAIAARLKEALEMSPDARAAHMRALREKIRANGLERWSANFLRALARELAPDADRVVEARAN